MTAVDTAALTCDLCDHLSSRQRPPAVFREIALEGSWGSRGRIDVAAITVKPNYAGLLIDGYEVKTSRADFRRDVEAMKWRHYLGVCDRLMFVTPPGLLSSDEIPAGAGLLVRAKTGTFTTVVRAPRHQPDRDDAAVLMRTIWRAATKPDPPDRESRMLAYREERRLAAALSDRARTMIREANDVLGEVERRRDAVERERKRMLDDVARASTVAPEVAAILHEVLRDASDALRSTSEFAGGIEVGALERLRQIRRWSERTGG